MNQTLDQFAAQPSEWDSYRANLPRHLIGLARYLQSSLMHTLIEECGHEGLALQFEPYITLTGTAGVGLGELARRLGEVSDLSRVGNDDR